MISTTVRIMRDGTGEAIRLSDRQLRQVIAESAAAVEADAKLILVREIYSQPLSPSGYNRTGHLLNSTSHEIASDGLSATVGNTADYAPPVHEGTTGRTGIQFLTEAVEKERRRIAGRARRISRGVIR